MSPLLEILRRAGIPFPEINFYLAPVFMVLSGLSIGLGFYARIEAMIDTFAMVVATCSKFLIEEWPEFVERYAEDLFRSKGIIAIRDVPERMVFQGVHGMFRITLGQAWATDERLSQAVFIGRNLRREDIVSGLESCRV